jgi:hypothetical protein
MPEARFKYKLPRENPFAFKGVAPQLLENTAIRVYDYYWIEEHSDEIPFIVEGNIVGHNPHFPWQYEGTEYQVEHKYNGSLPPGKYICHSETARKEYSPIKDEPLLLFKFAKIGRKPELNIDAIIQFVSEYGLLKDKETLFPAVKVPYDIYSVVAFHLYAREAYLITSMYDALHNLDHDKAAILLSDFFNVEEFSMTYDELGNWPQLLDEIYDSLPKDCRDAIRDEYENQDATEPPFLTNKERNELTDLAAEGQPDPEALVTDPEQIRQLEIMAMYNRQEPRKFVYRLEGLSAEVWIKIISKAPHSFILGVTADVIAIITNLRVSTEGSFYAKPVSPDKTDERYQFKGTWDGPSLLTSMWLLFYLRITNQLHVKFRICQACGEPIEKPRSNQKFCSNDNKCKARYNTNLKRTVEKLWEQGYSKKDILRETGATLVQIESWTSKLLR